MRQVMNQSPGALPAPGALPGYKESIVKHLANLPALKPWRALLAGLVTALGISAVVVWTWHMLELREQHESQRRFELDVKALGELVEARMNAYDMVLRGVSSAFVGGNTLITYPQWTVVVDQLRIQEIYPGISSVAWSRRLNAEQLDEFVERVRRDGRPDYRVFPEGARAYYQPIEYIGPINARTHAAYGLDILTQFPQSQAIQQAVDSGRTTLSQPLPDLYKISPEPAQHAGALMYFPVYNSGKPPQTLEERRASFMGMSNAAFRGDELAEGIFGALLQLFVIEMHDLEAGLPLFESQHRPGREIPPDWTPQFQAQLDLPLYGRTWRISVTGTPEYEHGVFARNQDLVLLMGLSTAVLVGGLAGAFVRQRDRQIHASQKVAAKLRDQADQLILASRYKSEFLANMSHELRTPLNSILILSDQLRQNAGGNLTDKQTRHADIVYRAGSDLLQLINDVLDLSKIEAGRMQLSMEPLNLQDLLVDLDASMRPLAEAKGLHLYIPQLTPDAGVPQRVYADRVRLHQILRNLLSNAIKFTDEGQVQVTISAGGKRKDGSLIIRFTVRDTGIGIDPAQHAQVFEAFQQIDGSTRRRFGGTGLGLVITRQLVQAMGGEIELDSALGEGSTFTACIPMQPIATLPQESTAPQRSGEGPALLVVEDDANFAAIIVEKAHAHGFSCVHCVSGTQALELLRKEAFVAVILDILLPDISGWQLFRRLRALPAHLHTPVHIISCLPQPSGLDTEHGTHYLTKPIGRSALEQVFTSLQEDREDGPALLLVEDVETEREHYRKHLTALGFAITVCENAQQARTAWAGNTFDVLVVDLNLPDGDGFALLDSLDRLRPLQGVRVVINTGLDVAQEGLQRLNGYSAVVVRKQGNDTTKLGQAVQGFLGLLEHNTDTATPPSAARPAAVLQGRRLLLVDDDIRNVYAMSALLDDFGFEISIAGNGEEAITRFQQVPLDLILMDMSMPVMDGYTATNLLKTEHGCTIPIIALTAHAMKGDREKCLAAGADDYLAKPVEREALRAMLERWLTDVEA